MKRKVIAALLLALLMLVPVQVFAQDGDPAPDMGIVTQADAQAVDTISVSETIVWLVFVIGGLAGFAMAVPTAIQVAKGEFLDKLLIVIWTAARTVIGMVYAETDPRFQEAVAFVRHAVIILVVAGAAWAVSDEAIPSIFEGAPDYIAQIDMIYLKLLATVILAAGAFVFYKKQIEDAIPVESFSARMTRVIEARAK